MILVFYQIILIIILDNIGKIENEKWKIFIKYYLKIIKIIYLRFKNDKKFAEWGEISELFFYNKLTINSSRNKQKLWNVLYITYKSLNRNYFEDMHKIVNVFEQRDKYNNVWWRNKNI